jgi:hypothetical protein
MVARARVRSRKTAGTFKIIVNELPRFRIESKTRWQHLAFDRSFFRMRPRSGFTLFELVLAVAIGLLIVTMMIPSMSGLFSAQKLERTFEEFDAFVRDARQKSIIERRDYVMVFEEGGITLEPAEPDEDDAGVEMPHLATEEGADLVIERPVALEKDPPMEWFFWKSGVCEPVIASYKGPLGTWTVQYDPLTARGTMLEQNSK